MKPLYQAKLQPSIIRSAEQARLQRTPTPSMRGPASRQRRLMGFPCSFNQIIQVLQEGVNAQSAQVVDARSAGRFNGTAPEPRAGLRGGHIPNSKNVVFSDVLTADGELVVLAAHHSPPLTQTVLSG